MPTTILFVSNVYPPHIIGGAELICHYQAKQMQRLGFNVHVFAGEGQRPGAHYQVTHEKYEGIPVDRIYLGAQDFSTDFVNFFHAPVEQRFSETLDRVKPDYIHMHNIISLSAGMARIAAERGIPVVVTVHDHWGHCLKNIIIRNQGEVCDDFTQCANCQPTISDGRDLNAPIRLRNDYLFLQLQHVSAFIVPSKYIASAYAKAGFPQEKLHVIWNGIDLKRFAAIVKVPSPKTLRFTFIGYLGEHKGLAVLLDALGRIGPHPGIKINIVGDGHLRPYLEKRARELGLEKQLQLWGKVPHGEIEKVFEQTDVQLMPSVWPENQPVSITEAMATRTPVVASNIGGIPEMVEDGVTGYLCEPGSADDLAKKILHLEANRGLVSYLGANGFERISGMSFERQVGRVVELYGKLSPVRSAPPARPLVLCLGPRFENRTFGAVEEINQRLGHARHLFAMYNWVGESQKNNATAVLVLPGCPVAEVRAVLRRGTPVIVPAEDAALVMLCQQMDCGLYYESAREAMECVQWLIDHPADRAKLSQNATAVTA